MPTGIVENFNAAANSGSISPTDGTPTVHFVAANIAPGTVLHEDARVDYTVAMVMGVRTPQNIQLV